MPAVIDDRYIQIFVRRFRMRHSSAHNGLRRFDVEDGSILRWCWKHSHDCKQSRFYLL